MTKRLPTSRRKQRGGYNPVTPAGPFTPLIGATPAWGTNPFAAGAVPNVALAQLMLGRSRMTGMPVGPITVPGITNIAVNTTDSALSTQVEPSSVLGQIMQYTPTPTTNNSSPANPDATYFDQSILENDITIEDITDGEFHDALEDFPGLEDARPALEPTGAQFSSDETGTGKGPLAVTITEFKSTVQEGITFLRKSGSEGFDVAFQKVSSAVDMLKNIPASASDVLSVKMLVDKATVAGSDRSDIVDVFAPHNETIRAAARKLAGNGLLNFDDNLRAVRNGITSVVTADAVSNLQQMYNDTEMLAIVEPRYQYVAGQLFWLKELAKSHVNQGGQQARAIRQLIDEYGESAINVARSIPGRAGEMLSATSNIASEKAADAKDFLNDVNAHSNVIRGQIYGTVADAAQAAPEAFARWAADNISDRALSAQFPETASFIKSAQSDTNAAREQFYGAIADAAANAPAAVAKWATDNISDQALTKQFPQTAEMIRSVKADTDSMRTQLYGTVGDTISKAASSAYSSTADYAGRLARGDIPNPLDAPVDFSADQAAAGVRWAQDQFARGSNWAKATYNANETMITFAQQIGILGSLFISSGYIGLKIGIPIGKYLGKKLARWDAKRVMRGKIKGKPGTWEMELYHMDGTVETIRMDNPDTVLRDMADEGAIMFNEPPLENSETKLDVAQNADGDVVNAVLDSKSEAVRRASLSMLHSTVIGAQALDQIDQASRAETTIQVTLYKPPVTLAIAAKKDSLRLVQTGRVGKVRAEQVKIPKTAVLNMLEQMKTVDPETVSAIISSSSSPEQVATLVHSNPIEAMRVLESSNANANLQEFSKALETIAIIPEVQIAKDVLESSAAAELINALPADVQGQVFDLVRYSQPIEIAKLMVEP